MRTTYPHAPRPHRARTISVTTRAHNPRRTRALQRTFGDDDFIQSMSHTGNYVDNGATEQVFGHLKAKVFRSQDRQTFESFKAGLDAYVTHWNTTRRQVKLKGLTPAKYRDQALQKAAQRLPSKASKFRGAVQETRPGHCNPSALTRVQRRPCRAGSTRPSGRSGRRGYHAR